MHYIMRSYMVEDKTIFQYLHGNYYARDTDSWNITVRFDSAEAEHVLLWIFRMYIHIHSVVRIDWRIAV